MFVVVDTQKGLWADVLDTEDDVIERVTLSELREYKKSGIVIKGYNSSRTIFASSPNFREVSCDSKSECGLVIMEVASDSNGKRYSGMFFYKDEKYVRNFVKKRIFEVRGILPRNFSTVDIGRVSEDFYFEGTRAVNVDITSSNLFKFNAMSIPVYWYRWFRVVDPEKRKVANLDFSTDFRNARLVDEFGMLTLWDIVKPVYKDGYLNIL